MKLPLFRALHLRIKPTGHNPRGHVARHHQVVSGRQPATQRRRGAGLVDAKNPVGERFLSEHAAQRLTGKRFLNVIQIHHEITLHQHRQDALAHLVTVWRVAHDRRRVSRRYQGRYIRQQALAARHNRRGEGVHRRGFQRVAHTSGQDGR